MDRWKEKKVTEAIELIAPEVTDTEVVGIAIETAPETKEAHPVLGT